MHPFIKFRNNLIRNGLEYFGLYYGFYEGLVSDNEDPENRGRVKLKCPAVYGDVEFPKWALPFGMFSGNKIGFYAIPPVNSPIWVTFKGGNPEFPIYTYGWYPQNYAPDEVEPGKYLFITPAGYKLFFDEKESLIKLYFDENREILMKGDETTITSGENSVTMKEKISINFGGVSMFELLNNLIDTTATSQMLGSAGPYSWSPDALAAFQEYIVELKKLME